MPLAGEIALVRLPHADATPAKLRPVVLLAKLHGAHNDWLVCMVSSRLHHEIVGFDERLSIEDADFAATGLKTTSLMRLGRLAVVH